jgi:hypothetical protein
MSQVWHFIKLAGAVVCGFAALVCLFVAMPYVVPLSAVSIAFSLMPE